MTVFRTLDMILVMVMICMAGFTYKVKYDVQKRISEVRHLEHEIFAEKNMVRMFRAEWAIMIEPSRMQRLAKRYQKELGLETIQPRQVVEFEDIPTRVHDSIEEVIKQNTIKEDKDFLAKNCVSCMNNFIQKGAQ
ncbi:cell division protein FtsL [Bartonella sp. CB175]|uniref:cell division protein FtsL n=1 Tax=Bartonella sp. CB175 TaxID=3112256 RepID=UPI00300E12EE